MNLYTGYTENTIYNPQGAEIYYILLCVIFGISEGFWKTSLLIFNKSCGKF
jgi:hypothetical protein